MFILNFIGTLFLSLAFVISYIYLYYLKNGKIVLGRIFAIEKYARSDQSNANQNSGMLYRPIYEFQHSSGLTRFSGGGSSKINLRIGQQVEILVLNQGPEYSMAKTNTAFIFSFVFSIIGLISLTISWHYLQEWYLRLIPLVIIFSIFVFFFFKNKKYFLLFLDALIKNNNIVSEDNLNNREIYFTQNDFEKAYNRDLKSYAKSLLVLNVFFISFFLFLYNQIENYKIQNILNYISEKNWISLIKYFNDPILLASFIIFLMSSVLVLSSIPFLRPYK